MACWQTARRELKLYALWQVQLVMDAGWRSHDSNSTWVDVEQL